MHHNSQSSREQVELPQNPMGRSIEKECRRMIPVPGTVKSTVASGSNGQTCKGSTKQRLCKNNNCRLVLIVTLVASDASIHHDLHRFLSINSELYLSLSLALSDAQDGGLRGQKASVQRVWLPAAFQEERRSPPACKLNPALHQHNQP